MSNDPSDAIVCLRLELHRVRDQFTMVNQVLEFERKENLRLRNEREVLLLDIASLKAEVERLTKAGDAMACHLVCSDLPNDVCGDLMKKWNAAKEGKPQP